MAARPGSASLAREGHYPGRDSEHVARAASLAVLLGVVVLAILKPGGAGVAAFPVNRWLIARGKGHAVVHAHHH